MKIITEQHLEEYSKAVRRGALEGAVAGAAIAASAGLYLNRRWVAYRKMPLSLKVLGGVIVISPLTAVQAERRGLEYDRSQWYVLSASSRSSFVELFRQGPTANMLGEKQERSEAQWGQMSTRDKFAQWSERHQYSIIFGGWAGSLMTAGAFIWRDKYQTPAQKIVQARMWAQGLTICLLIAAGALTHSKQRARTNIPQPDHSWIEVLEQHEKERLEAEEEAHALTTKSGL